MTGPLKPDYVFYHSPCLDGLVAAWIIRNHFGERGIKFVPFDYGDPFMSTMQFDGKHVLFVDVSIPRDAILSLAGSASHVTILDHHKTAAAALEGLNDVANITARFDMEQSGAGLAWSYVNGSRADIPRIAELVEDRDLWRFRHDPETTWMHRFLEIGDLSFGWIDKAAEILANDDLESVGGPLDRIYREKIERLAKSASRIGISGHDVPIVQCEKQYASDVGHTLLKKFPDAPFAACYCVDEKGHGRMSLRSDDARADVSEIAKGFGGGGHRNAAGFRCDLLPLSPYRTI